MDEAYYDEADESDETYSGDDEYSSEPDQNSDGYWEYDEVEAWV
jgi:hypothetical protein